MKTVIVRPPAASLAEGLVTHIDRTPVDVELATRQWKGYVSALTTEGWRVVGVPLANDMADSVFIEDTVVIFGDTAVVTSPGDRSRRGARMPRASGSSAASSPRSATRSSRCRSAGCCTSRPR
jgi:dimethylargininase